MFEYLRHKAATAAFKGRTILVSCADCDALVPICRTVDATDGEASFIDSCALTRCLGDVWIDIHLVLRGYNPVRTGFARRVALRRV